MHTSRHGASRTNDVTEHTSISIQRYKHSNTTEKNGRLFVWHLCYLCYLCYLVHLSTQTNI